MCPEGSQRQVYLLDPQCLKPEVIAVAFARTSRSPQTFHEIAAELSAEKSAEFHEKWVVGYGHASVAEHAVLHVAIENLSRLAVETLESNRLASYTEKSTRYQKWGTDDFYTPSELIGHPLLSLYQQTIRRLFSAYHQSLPRVRAVIAAENLPQPGESDSAYERRIRSDYVDVCRFLLPAASLANVGMTINARALEHCICKMLSHPLAEVRQLGEEIKQVAQAEVPTLVKYAERVEYLAGIQEELESVFENPPFPVGGDLRVAPGRTHDDPGHMSNDLGHMSNDLGHMSNGPGHMSNGPGRTHRCAPTAENSLDWCRMVHFEPEGELRAMAAALFRYGNFSYAQALDRVKALDLGARQLLAHTLLGAAGKHDIPLRELEHTSFTFEVTLDQGAYAELKRHRMMTQTPQALTPHLGYAIPRAITAAGLEPDFREAMDAARQAYEQIAAAFPAVASYVIPNACNRRVLLTFNLRTADHFVALRTAPNAHFSIRRVAQCMTEQIRQVAPLLGAHLRANPDERWRGIEQRYFSQVF
jgi:thymidylate synthase ThyX